MGKRVPASNSILVQAPCRVDLAGGTLDLWPLYLFHPGSVTVNFAIEILTTCRVSPQPGTRIVLRSLDTDREEQFASFPSWLPQATTASRLRPICCVSFNPKAASGSKLFPVARRRRHFRFIGVDGRHDGSSCPLHGTTLVARADARDRAEYRGAGHSRSLRLSGLLSPALYGGVSAIDLAADGIHRRALPISPEQINSRFVLAYSGLPRQSGINNWQVFSRHIEGDKRVQRNFDQIAAIAGSMRAALALLRWDEVARLLREEWNLRKSNAPGITTPAIDRLVKIAARHGGVAAKVCEAGGGAKRDLHGRTRFGADREHGLGLRWGANPSSQAGEIGPALFA